jgi:hypothetical protein
MPSRRLVWLCALWSAVDAGCSATAQELRPEATKPTVVAEVGPEMTVYPGRYREADGHWSAVRGGGRADSDLRVNVWQLLAQLGDGSTLRSGPRRLVVTDVVKWLLAEQDDRGRIRLRTDPDWLLDHAMATFALAEAMRSSSCAWLGAPVRAATMHLAEHIVVVRPPPGPELRLWCELLATSLLRIEALSDERGPRHFEVGAATLAAGFAALPEVAPATDRERAAQWLRETRAGKDVAAAVVKAWPAEPLLDPLLTLYLAAAAYQSGGATWTAVSDRIQRDIVRRQIDRGDERGAWPAAGPFAEQNGSFGVQALTITTLEIYYRYCQLGLWP